MARAGHSDFKTTQAYIDLAGEMFREEAERLERRLWGSDQYQIPVPNRIRRQHSKRTGGRASGRNR
jgi:hypothetical protein